MPVVKRHADLAVRLESANARAMAGAGIDDHVGPLPVVGLDPLGRDDFQQHVIAGMRQRLAVERDFMIVDQHRRRAGGLMGDVVVAALAQHVERQPVALGRVAHVFVGRLVESPRARQIGDFLQGRARRGQGFLRALAMIARDLLRVNGREFGEVLRLPGADRAILGKAGKKLFGVVGRGHGRLLKSRAERGVRPRRLDWWSCVKLTPAL